MIDVIFIRGGVTGPIFAGTADAANAKASAADAAGSATSASGSATSAAASANAYPDVAAAVGPDLLSGVTGSTVGSTTPNTSTAPVGQAYANDIPAANAQILQTVSVRLSATGTGNVEIVAPVNGVQTILTVIPVTVTTIPQTLTMPANTVLPKNGRVFYRRLTGGTLRYVVGGAQVNYTDADAADNQVTLASGASTVALSYTARAAGSTLSDRVTANETLTAQFKSYQYALGKETTPVAGTGTNTGSNTWILGLPNARSGLLRVQAFGGPSGGTIKVRRFTKSGGTFTQTSSDILVAVPANALATVETGVVVNAGEYLGFYAPANSLGFNSGDTANNAGRYTGTGDVTTVSGGRTTTGAFQLRFDVASAQALADLDSRLGQVENKVYATVAGNPDDLGVGSGGFISGNTFAFYNPIEVGGRLRVRVRGGPGWSGSIPIRRFTRSGSTYTQIGSDIWVPVQIGQVTVFDTGVTVNAGEFLGFSGLGLSGMVAFTNGVSRSGGFVVGSGDVTTFTDSVPDNSGSFEIAFDVPGDVGGGGGSAFEGANLVCLGDSMTEGKAYPGVVAERLGLSAIECGFGGSQLTNDPVGDSDRYGVSICAIAAAIASGDWSSVTTFANGLGSPWSDTAARLAAVDWSTINYISIFIGTNDYGAGAVPLGLNDSTNQAEFYGAWNYVIPTILAAKPWIKLFVMTPTYRSRFVAGDGHDSDIYANSQGLVLPKYADATIDRAKARHIPVLDLNRTSGFNASTASYYLVDGLHQNPTGDALLGGKVAAFMAANF
jgi:lysophospholipase L1-like esterase